jgi:hypothetical protein
MTRLIGSLLVLTVLSSGSALSGQSRSPDEKSERSVAGAPAKSEADTIRARIKEGQKVRVTDEQGREWHGRIGELASDHLTLLTSDRQRRDVAYRTILRIDRPHDTLANGALIGFTSGAALGLLAVVSEENRDCEPAGFFSCGDPPAAAYLVAPLVLGGLGAGVGVGIDALIRRDANLFQRGEERGATLTPVLGRSVRGLAVSVHW